MLRGLGPCQSPMLTLNKYRLKRKEKNKSREEIFYQMKDFLGYDQL